MKQRLIPTLLAGSLLLVSGCLHSEYKGESFAPTSEVRTLESEVPAPAGYESIGQARVWGEASGTTDAELQQKMLELAKQNGADAVRFLGIVRIPAGMTASQPDLSGSLDPGEREFNRAGLQIMDTPGVNSATPAYNRQLNAEFFRLAPTAK